MNTTSAAPADRPRQHDRATAARRDQPVTWALAEVGRPESPHHIMDGGDVDPLTGRLLSVRELQTALRAARSGLSRQPPDGTGAVSPACDSVSPAGAAARGPAPMDVDVDVDVPLPMSTSMLGQGGRAAAAPAGPDVLRPPAGRRWIAVVGAHRGAGASTVALALADAAAAAGWPVHLVSCNPQAECGLVGAATVELGTDPTGAWRTGRRGVGVTLARPAPGPDRSARSHTGPRCGAPWPSIPPLPPGVDERDLLTVVDVEAGAARGPHLLATAAAVLLVCRISIPSAQQAEHLLEALLSRPRTDPAHDDRAQDDPAQDDPAQAAPAQHQLGPGGSGPVVLVAALGDLDWSGRWPRAVRRAAGPRLAQLQGDGRVVTVPLDRHLASYRPTGGALPRAVTRSVALAVPLLAGGGALHRPPALTSDPGAHAGCARSTPAQPAPDLLLTSKDTA